MSPDGDAPWLGGRSAGLVGSIYLAALGAMSWRDALDELSGAVGGVGAALIRIDGAWQSVSSHALIPYSGPYFDGGWHQVDPRVQFFRGTGSATATSTVVTDRDLERDHRRALTEIHEGFLRKHGLGDFSGSLVSVPSGNALLVVNRAAGKGGFVERDLVRVGQAAQHFGRALTIAEELAQVRATAASGVLAAFESVGVAAAHLDRAGRVTAMNPAAGRVLEHGYAVIDGRIRSRSSSGQAAIDHLIENAVVHSSSTATLIGSVSDRSIEPLVGRAVPLGTSAEPDSWSKILRTGGGVLLVLAPIRARRHRPAAAGVLQALGLSRAEARISLLVGTGEAPAEAAGLLGITDQTARSYLKSAYAKLGITRQGQLASLVSQVASIFPEPGEPQVLGGRRRGNPNFGVSGRRGRAQDDR